MIAVAILSAVANVTAVSYTHLDVYKRQGVPEGNGNFPGVYGWHPGMDNEESF